MKLAPSILSADIGALDRAVAMAEEGGADLLHVDVMDGHFVPNLSFGMPLIEALRRRTDLPLDVHLMVDNPGDLLDEYVAAGAAWLSLHWEAASHLHRLLDRLRQKGVRAGVALNPTTPIEVLRDCLAMVDFVLVMSVNPGFSGQSFIPESLERVGRLRRLIDEAGDRDIEIEMDGGIGPANIGAVVRAGVDVCVAGSEVYGQPDPVAAIRGLRSAGEGGA